MSNIFEEKNKTAYLYGESIQDKLQKICEPLSSLGITHFNHLKVFNDGSLFLLTNNIDFQRDYFFKEGGFGNIFKDVYSSTKSKKYFLTPSDKENIQKDRTLELMLYHNVLNSLCLYKNTNGFLSGFCFGTNRNDTIASTFYLNTLPLLEHFIKYFNEQACDLMDLTDKHKLAQFDQKFNFHNNSADDFEAQKVQEFLQQTQLKNFSLSPRQKECLFQLTRGKTAKQTARILGIDHRTVETHIISLKSKMECTTKEQLIERAFESGFADLAPQSLVGK